MPVSLARKLSLPFIAAVTAALTWVGAPPAAADTDPISGGTVTLNVSLSAAATLAVAGVLIVPIQPTTMTYDVDNSVFRYVSPVYDGNASTKSRNGSLTLGGGFIIADTKTSRTVTLALPIFDLAHHFIKHRFDMYGHHTYTTTEPETFTASSLQVAARGAALFNYLLHTDVFKQNEVIGSFSASWTRIYDP